MFYFDVFSLKRCYFSLDIGEALRCSFPKFYTIFLSLSLFIYGIFSFNISFFTSFFFSFDLNNKFTHQTQVIFHKYTVFMTIYRINMWLTHSFAHTHRERERERETEVRTLPKSTFMITFQYH